MTDSKDDKLTQMAEEVEAEREADGKASIDVDEDDEATTREDHNKDGAPGPLNEEASDVPMGVLRGPNRSLGSQM